MYRISELALLVGLSRTALLYYEKLNLINGKRQENGYRVYSVHVPALSDHPFRFNPITDFGLIRSPISELSDQK